MKSSKLDHWWKHQDSKLLYTPKIVFDKQFLVCTVMTMLQLYTVSWTYFQQIMSPAGLWYIVALYPAWYIAAASCFDVLKPSCPSTHYHATGIVVLVDCHFSISLDHHIECNILVSTRFHSWVKSRSVRKIAQHDK